jgi:hypothetical protein
VDGGLSQLFFLFRLCSLCTTTGPAELEGPRSHKYPQCLAFIEAKYSSDLVSFGHTTPAPSAVPALLLPAATIKYPKDLIIKPETMGFVLFAENLHM